MSLKELSEKVSAGSEALMTKIREVPPQHARYFYLPFSVLILVPSFLSNLSEFLNADVPLRFGSIFGATLGIVGGIWLPILCAVSAVTYLHNIKPKEKEEAEAAAEEEAQQPAWQRQALWIGLFGLGLAYFTVGFSLTFTLLSSLAWATLAKLIHLFAQANSNLLPTQAQSLMKPTKSVADDTADQKQDFTKLLLSQVEKFYNQVIVTSLNNMAKFCNDKLSAHGATTVDTSVCSAATTSPQYMVFTQISEHVQEVEPGVEAGVGVGESKEEGNATPNEKPAPKQQPDSLIDLNKVDGFFKSSGALVWSLLESCNLDNSKKNPENRQPPSLT